MKSPKTFLLLSVIVAVLVLGIAYAAIGNITLTVNGSATAAPDATNYKVAFTGDTTLTGSFINKDTTIDSLKSAGKVSISATADAISATLTINEGALVSVGDTITATLDIKNSSVDLQAAITDTTTNSNEEYFEVTSSLSKGTLLPDGKTSADFTDSATLTITVKLIKTPLAAQNATITTTVLAVPSNYVA